MSVKDLISAAFNKDANSFESTLHAIMQEKMSAAIQARFSPAVYEEEVDLDEAKDDSEDDESTEEDDDEDEEKGLKEADGAAEASKYHRDMEAHHDAWSRAHDHEANNAGPRIQEKHSYAETHHANAENYHKKAREVLKTHGVDSPEYKKARSKANNASDIANESTSETPKKWKTAGKPTHQTPAIKEEAEQIDEISRKTLASYVKKAAGVGHRNTLPNAMRDRATAASIGDKEWYKQSGRNADNRSKGIQRAADRLAKEETEE